MKRKKTSKYKGVSRFRDKWRVRFRKLTIGFYYDEYIAGKIYNYFSTHPNQLAEEFECVKCKRTKRITEFYVDKRKVTKISSICKVCHIMMTTLNTSLYREGLNKEPEAIKFIALKRLIKLKHKQIITDEQARDIFNRQDGSNIAFSIRIKS